MTAELVLHTLTTKSRNREAIKPAELIQVTGHHELTLNARRAITILWYNAHMQGVEAGKDYSIEIDDLKPDSHKGYEMVEEAVEALMRTLLTVRLSDGSTRRVQFLGGNDMDARDRKAGVLTYSFDKRLIDILRDSTIWGKIALPVLMAVADGNSNPPSFGKAYLVYRAWEHEMGFDKYGGAPDCAVTELFLSLVD